MADELTKDQLIRLFPEYLLWLGFSEPHHRDGTKPIIAPNDISAHLTKPEYEALYEQTMGRLFPALAEGDSLAGMIRTMEYGNSLMQLEYMRLDREQRES